MIELIGVSGSVLVLISFLFSNEIKIRLVNIIGALLFVIYGLCIQALSVWLLNGILILIHLLFLFAGNKKWIDGNNC